MNQQISLMKKPVLLFLAGIASLLLLSFSVPQRFTDLLTRANMIFNEPDSLVEAPIEDNSQMRYDYALVTATGNFEARYVVRPLDSMLAKYQKDTIEKKPGTTHINPNKLHKAFFTAILMNISGGKMPNIKALDPAAVKVTFNSDWGAVAETEVKGKFAGNYQRCTAFAMHKDEVGDAYLFLFADSTINKQRFGQLANTILQSLRFK